MSEEEMSKKEFVEALFEGMPAELKDALMKAACKRSDEIVSDHRKRRETRAALEASGDADAIKGFESACNMYDLNVQVVQLLGNLKAMLEGFNPNDLSSGNLKENLNLMKHLHMTMAISMENMRDRINALAEDNNNENRNGEASG